MSTRCSREAADVGPCWVGPKPLARRLSQLAVPGILAVMALPAISRSEGRAGIAGVGARPLTDAVAATWFIETASPGEYRMALVVFLVGTPGWTKKHTDWDWGASEPAHSTFVVDGQRLHVEYSNRSGRWSVMKAVGNVKDANVVVVSGIGTSPQRVIHTDKLRLSVRFDSDPILEVVKQSARLRGVLGLD